MADMLIRCICVAVTVLLAMPATLLAGDFSRDFAVVFIDQAAEARYGKFPVDRGVLANAIQKAADAGARGIVLKFFLDLPRSPEGDQALAKSLSRIPVLLQARIDDSEKNPNALPARFVLAESVGPAGVSGSSGWIPLATFSDPARDVCFVDFNSPAVPLVETYQGKAVKSLVLCATEMALATKAVVGPGKNISIGKRLITVDDLYRASVRYDNDRPVSAFSFNDVMDGKVASENLNGKVVIIGYDGASVPRIGGVGIHRLFVQILSSFYESMPTNGRR